MPEHPPMPLAAAVLDCPGPRALARFYAELLDWPIGTDDPGWATRVPGGPGPSFQLERAHVARGRARWPRWWPGSTTRPPAGR